MVAIATLEPWRKPLLRCGIAAPILFVSMTLFVGLWWDGYSVTAQTPSELSAIDAPTRPLWTILSVVYAGLMIAFSWIVWRSAPPNRALRVVGALLMIQCVAGAVWPPMHQRAVLAAGGGTLTDTLHLVWAAASVVLFMGAMGFGAAALGKRFRVYSILTLLITFASGAWTATYAARVQTNLPTPGLGIWERISIAAFMVWIVVLATALLRDQKKTALSRPSAFKTPEGEARFFAVYDAAMARWPVPYEEIGIPGRFGTTHVVVCGPKTAPPLMLVHGYMATLTMWVPSILALSKGYRVYAVDVMGQAGRSIPGEPIATAADFAAWLTETLDALHLERVSLVGMSFGGWLALNYAVAAPQRVRKLVLLSPGGLLPMAPQFKMRAMVMALLPTRVTVDAFFRWLGFADRVYAPVLDLMYLGMKHFRMPLETARVQPAVVPDEALRSLKVPVLLLIGDREVICDPARALERARRLIPYFEGDLVPGCRHDMCTSQHQIVDARVLEFLKGGLYAFHTPRDPRVGGGVLVPAATLDEPVGLRAVRSRTRHGG